MDPLSVSASILTVVATVNGGLAIVNRLLNAPEELQALVTELADLAPIIRNIGNLPHDHLVQNGLLAQLEVAKAILLELEELICYRLTKASGSRVDRTGWASRKTQIDLLRKQLKDKRDVLTTTLAIMNSSSSIRIEESINNVHESLQNLQHEQREIRGMLNSLANRWVEQEKRMEKLSAQAHMAIQNQERLALLLQNLQVPALLLSAQSETSRLGIDGASQQLQKLQLPGSTGNPAELAVGHQGLSRETRNMMIMTTASIIFLPLSFVTSLYGTNLLSMA